MPTGFRASLPSTASRHRKRLQFAQHRRDEFRHGGVNVHGPLDYCVWRFGIHDVEDRVDGLIASGSQDGGA